jgi:MFS family permease
MPQQINQVVLQPLAGKTFESEKDFSEALTRVLGADVFEAHKTTLISGAIQLNTGLILWAIIAFVASFAVSIGPVMWVLFSELFPNRIRGTAISFVGLINSAVSFLVQWIFPWQLDHLGSALTFLIYGVFAALGLIFIVRFIPETKGKSLEELEKQLVKSRA